MNLGRCPVCHSRISLEAICQDEAGRELLGLLAGLDSETGTALVGYLGLFRPEKRDLANSRALRLAGEALALCPDYLRLSRAMRETVEAIMARGGVPLKNHNYLKRVIETMAQQEQVKPAETGLAPVKPEKTGQNMPQTKTGQAMARLLSGA